MTMTCRTCRHPERASIDRALADGEPERSIAQRYGLNASSVHRHARLHVTKQLAKASVALERSGVSILTHLVELQQKAMAILNAPEDQRTALMAVREVARIVELMGRVTGELMPIQVQQVYIGLGVADEAELRKIVEQHKAASTLTLDDAERDAVEALKLVFSERPERRGPVLAELSSEATETEGADEIAVRE